MKKKKKSLVLEKKESINTIDKSEDIASNYRNSKVNIDNKEKLLEDSSKSEKKTHNKKCEIENTLQIKDSDQLYVLINPLKSELIKNIGNFKSELKSPNQEKINSDIIKPQISIKDNFAVNNVEEDKNQSPSNKNYFETFKNKEISTPTSLLMEGNVSNIKTLDITKSKIHTPKSPDKAIKATNPVLSENTNSEIKSLKIVKKESRDDLKNDKIQKITEKERTTLDNQVPKINIPSTDDNNSKKDIKSNTNEINLGSIIRKKSNEIEQKSNKSHDIEQNSSLNPSTISDKRKSNAHILFSNILKPVANSIDKTNNKNNTQNIHIQEDNNKMRNSILGNNLNTLNKTN